jgi:putative GTP pyrophosphokinase
MARMTREEKAFLAAHNLDRKAYTATGLTWADLQEIRNHHVSQAPSLTSTGRYITERLTDVPGVHSLKMRVKDPDHLVAKIIRKAIERPKKKITLQNYSKKITDLIGLRALHLFKEDWTEIHSAICSTWELKEHPIAYLRKGDSEELAALFRTNSCRVKEHPYGYRSVHYLVQSAMEREPVSAEIQVRTLFEEGWSEIDHRIRYPHDIANPIFAQFLVIFNRLAGSADEIGSFIRFLKNHLTLRDANAVEERSEYLSQIASMKAEIAELAVDRKVRQELEKRLAAISQAGTRNISVSSPSSTTGPITMGNLTAGADTVLTKLAVPNLGLGSEALRQSLANLESFQSTLNALSTANVGKLSFSSPPGLLASALKLNPPSSGKPKGG